MTTCEVCGRTCPQSDAYCGSCGHELGSPPGVVTCRSPVQSEEPTVVNVRVVNSFWDGCVGCFGWVVGVLVIAVLIGWVLSC